MKEIYEISNFINLSNDLNKPLNKTHRIQYTCFDASANYIVCGATSGSLYLFQRNPCKFLQLIPNIFGSISHVAISPQEHYVGFVTQKGTVLLYVIDLMAVQPVVVSSYYREMSITQLKWKQNEHQMFFGDLKGNVFLVNLNNFLGRSLTNISIHPILFLESPVVQICVFDQLLLVSNYTKCILCNTETEEFKQIGNQPRDGRFGACFLFDNVNSTNNVTELEFLSTARIVCARPGSRMWECNIDGNVLQTHKFKSALKSCSPTIILGSNEKLMASEQMHKPQAIDQLIHLQPINVHFILGYSRNTLYMFDLKRSSVVLWNDEFDSIHTLKVIENEANTIVLFTNESKVFTFQLIQLDQLFYDTMAKERLLESGQLLLQHSDYFKEKMFDSTFRYYYSLLLSKLDNFEGVGTLLNNLRLQFDIILEKFAENDEKMRKLNGIRVENSVYVIENTFAPNITNRSDRVVPTKQTESKYFIPEIFNDNTEILSSYDDEIVVPTKTTVANVKLSDACISSIPFEQNTLGEDKKIVQNLFFIYKSLKISNFNLVDRYADIFDNYSLGGIIRLLGALELMISENDHGVSETVAKQHCAQMYLNYIKTKAKLELNDDSRDFIIDCFLCSNKNHQIDDIQRCKHCSFPLIVEMTVLKYREIADAIVTYLWTRNEHNSLSKIIEQVPAMLNYALKSIIGNKLNSGMDSGEFEMIVDMLFACANQLQLEQYVEKYAALRTYDFWDAFLRRLVLLHTERQIVCVQCRRSCVIDVDRLAVSKAFYAYDYVINVCADHMDGMMALELCSKYASKIPCDAISKQFYLKCLLNS